MIEDGVAKRETIQEIEDLKRLNEPQVRSRPSRRFEVLLAVISAIAFAGRVFYTWRYQRDTPVVGDTVSYHNGANVLADGNGYIDPIRFLLFGIRTPSAYHPPLYLTYLAFWSKLGLRTAFQHRIVSCLLGAATVWVVGRLGHRLGTRLDPKQATATGLIAAAFAALYPHLWLNDGALLSESAGALGIVIAVLAAARLVDRPRWSTALAFGAAGGLASLGRAEMMLFVPLVGGPWLVRAARHEGMRTALKYGAAIGAGTAMLIGPWVVYNLTRFERPVYLSTGLGATLTGGSCDGAFFGAKLGYWDSGPGCVAYQADPGVTGLTPGTPEFYAVARRNLANEGDESEREAAARSFALDYLSDHRGRLITAVIPARVGRIWGVFRPWQTARFDGAIEGRGVGRAQAALLSYYALMTCGVIGMVAIGRRRAGLWPFLALITIVTTSTALAFGVQRYRIPLDAVLPALAAVGVVALGRDRARRGRHAPDGGEANAAETGL